MDKLLWIEVPLKGDIAYVFGSLQNPKDRWIRYKDRKEWNNIPPTKGKLGENRIPFMDE